MFDKLRVYRDLLAYWKGHVQEFAQSDYRGFQKMLADVEPLIGSVEGKRVLDVGCGQRAPVTLMLHSLGAEVTGIDLEVAESRDSQWRYLRLAAQSGLERAIKTFVRELMYDRRYFAELQRFCSFPLVRQGLDLRAMDVTELDFADETFDLLVSVAVFEHIRDVSLALAELKRVMKRGAIARIRAHLFTSLSGGHNLRWAYPDTDPPDDVPPWDHLRQNVFPARVYLNKWRLHQYRESIENVFEILDWKTQTEGERLLTPEIREELSEYSEEELTTRGINVIARRA